MLANMRSLLNLKDNIDKLGLLIDSGDDNGPKVNRGTTRVPPGRLIASTKRRLDTTSCVLLTWRNGAREEREQTRIDIAVQTPFEEQR